MGTVTTKGVVNTLDQLEVLFEHTIVGYETLQSVYAADSAAASGDVTDTEEGVEPDKRLSLTTHGCRKVRLPGNVIVAVAPPPDRRTVSVTAPRCPPR